MPLKQNNQPSKNIHLQTIHLQIYLLFKAGFGLK